MSKRKAAQRQRCYHLTVCGLNDRPHRERFRSDPETYQGKAVDLTRDLLRNRWGRLSVTKPDGSTWDTDVPGSGQ